MTSEIETLKTNEFLRRRKLRLQQVREQSKDIAKKLRLRAQVEKLRRIVELDEQKENEYLERQERIVEQLEQVYAKGKQQTGAGHSRALVEKSHVVGTAPVGPTSIGSGISKPDVIKLRAREAAAQLRQRKQELLDNKNRSLQRKLKAREAANVISREKSKSACNSKEPSALVEGSEQLLQLHIPSEIMGDSNNDNAEKLTGKEPQSKGIGTDPTPLQDRPVSALGLEPEVSSGVRCSTGEENLQYVADNPTSPTKTTKNRRHILQSQPIQGSENNNGKVTGAVRGRHKMATEWDNELIPNEWVPNVTKPKLPDDNKVSTVFIDAVQNPRPAKPNDLFAISEDMPETLWTKRAYSPPTVSVQSRSSLTLVSEYLQQRKLRLREHDAPGPSKRHERKDELQNCKQTIAWARSTINEAYAGSPELKIVSLDSDKAKADRGKKSNITMYNHFTKDKRVVAGGESKLVMRDDTPEEDAYSIAMRQSDDFNDKPRQEKPKANRSRIASDKQTVEKEYQDTMAFLNSLAKEQSFHQRPIKKAFMDGARQQNFEERHQRKMQHEYRKIEKEAMRKQSSKSPTKDTQGRRTKSPGKPTGGDVGPGDFQYSWMPVPESDASLFVHTIPTVPKDNVKFNNVDCYHEYRSRHEHTPPTRDKHSHKTQDTRTRQEEPDSFMESEDYSEASRSTNDYSLEEDRRKKKSTNQDSSSAERIIVYKILDGKRKKDKSRKKSKFSGDNLRSVTSVKKALVKTKKVVTESRQGSLEHLNEGVYKNVAQNGQFCNIISSEKTNIEFWQTSLETKPWWENIQSLYFPEAPTRNLGGDLTCADGNKQFQHEQLKDKRQMQWDCGDKVLDERTTVTTSSHSHSKTNHTQPNISHAACTKSSTSRGKSESTERETVLSNVDTLTTGNVRPEGGYVKLVGDKGQETEKFILGAAGLLNDDGYEVVIQLRKKDTGQKLKDQEYKLKDNPSQDLEGVTEVTSKLLETVSSKSSLPYLEPDLEEKPSTVSQPTRDVEQPIPPQPKDKEIEQGPINTEPMKQTACTQTSLLSPTQRSLMFMSSSTSTAYMSPPEMILPACLKHDSGTNTNKVSDSSKSRLSENPVFRGGKKHVKCGCTHVKSVSAKISEQTIKDCQAPKSSTKVPPNTARSDVVFDVEKKTSRKCNCPKCCCDTGTKNKHKKRRSRRYHQSSEKDHAVRKQTVATTKLYKEELNPIIKDYVKRLLTLNKEGLKAIEVLNQECSSVTTPGSSIINIDSNVEDKRSTEAKLSLEHLKNILLQKIDEESKKSIQKVQSHRKKKPVHKIKSLNISKHLLRKKSDTESTSKPSEDARLPSSTSANDDTHQPRLETMIWNRSPRQADHKKDLEEKNAEASISSTSASEPTPKPKKNKTSKHKAHSRKSPSLPLQRVNPSDTSSTDYKAKSCGCSATVTTQQRENNSFDKNITREVNFMAIAETKVQNMERIANLTEKCTQRLSNLAKVLEEVRKNKSSAFNHISTGESSSESEQKTNKKNAFKSLSQSHLTQYSLEAKDNLRQSAQSLPTKSFDSSIDGVRVPEISFDSSKSSNAENKLDSPREYPSMLEGIPKPGSHISTGQVKPPSEINNNGDYLKRGKPPPALARMKHAPDDVVPHELSTVVEVDSPMSMKFKPQESLAPENKDKTEQEPKEKTITETRTESLPNPDLLQSNVKWKSNRQSAKKRDGTKMEMMDLNKFNEIMLKPFVSIEEFAKQCNVGDIDDGSNIGDIPKDLTLNDDLSSMHSEASLPDVIGELLKRNVITEPFNFDTASNIHSTTISSESSISVLALSKLSAKDKKRPYISIANREFAETSDTLSISSNPDLENAFKKLGMGWASSTLKKTKERLALSSSSSSSSSSQKYMLKAFEKHESPAKKLQQNKTSVSVSTLKNAEQQTVHLKGVTVKEFLTQELAHKITFNNKSKRDETEQEFISLHETKMPEEMKHSMGHDRTGDNSGANANRARTSTPVQLFKSLTYHSSSSSNNLSNGLFSNVDDLSSVKVTSSSLRNHSTSDKDDLTIPNFSLKLKRNISDVSKSD